MPFLEYIGRTLSKKSKVYEALCLGASEPMTKKTIPDNVLKIESEDGVP